MTSDNLEASLLGIPRELRLQIYDYARTTELLYRPITHWQDRFVPSSASRSHWGFHSRPVRDPAARLQLPWLNLMLSCKSIYTEMDAYICDVSAETEEADPDLVVDVQPVGGSGSYLGPVTWTAIRRPLNRANILLVNMDYKSHFRVWGDGGPMPILRSLYQALNHIVHCGPQMDPKRPLSTPLRLRELILNIRNNGTQEQRPSILELEFRKLTQMGDVGRHVDVATLKARATVERFVLDKEQAGLPQVWESYGFEWGMELYQEDIDQKELPSTAV